MSEAPNIHGRHLRCRCGVLSGIGGVGFSGPLDVEIRYLMALEYLLATGFWRIIYIYNYIYFMVMNRHEYYWGRMFWRDFLRFLWYLSLGPSQVHGPSASSGSSDQGGWDRLELNSSHWVWWRSFRKEVIETSNVCGSKKLFNFHSQYIEYTVYCWNGMIILLTSITSYQHADVVMSSLYLDFP